MKVDWKRESRWFASLGIELKREPTGKLFPVARIRLRQIRGSLIDRVARQVDAHVHRSQRHRCHTTAAQLVEKRAKGCLDGWLPFDSRRLIGRVGKENRGIVAKWSNNRSGIEVLEAAHE